MKKTNLHLWLMGALLCGLSLGVTSCKDDDKDNNEPSAEEKAEQAKEQADIFWGVVDELAGIDAITDDYQNKDFEPIIGSPSDENPQYRIVNTNDMETTAMRFNQLIGEDKVDENTAEYTYQNDAVGTLTYRKSTDGKSWATVDVSIKQMPRLERIIYMKPSQGGDNKSFEGTAYYRFGDVVKKKNADGNDEYWICVRPCFGPESKDKSHWVTVSPLPKKNIQPYTGSNGINYALPKGLGDNKEHAQNFAEMLFAIYFPDEWQQNIINNPYKGITNKGITMFHDFDKANLMYHSNFFWKRVQKAWDRDLMEKVFGLSGGDPVNYFQTMLKSKDGLNLLTIGYSWMWWLAGQNSPTLYRQRFTNGTGKESNMHKGGKIESVKKEVIKSKITLDVTKYTSFGWLNTAFFDTENRHYIVRFASGAELASNKTERPKEPLAGVEEVYNYNKYYNIDVTQNPDPETFDAQGNPSGGVAGYESRAYYMVGDVVKDQEDQLWLCVQSSSYGYDNQLSEPQPYSYFVSFDFEPMGGNQLVFLPTSKELTAQMLFNIELFHHNYQKYQKTKESTVYKQEQNIREKFRVKWSELVGVRDTLHKFSNDSKAVDVECSFVSALYREGNEIRVLRLVADYTAEQEENGRPTGVRDWSWYFYTNYTNSNTPMKLEDLEQQYMVDRYNKDKWVSLPWIDIYTKNKITANTGPRTKADDVDENVDVEERRQRFFYQAGRTAEAGTIPTNMYREPLIVFTVHRVKDEGQKSLRFEDANITFTEYAMMKDVSDGLAEDDTSLTNINATVYNQWSVNRIYLENNNWKFGMANNTPFME